MLGGPVSLSASELTPLTSSRGPKFGCVFVGNSPFMSGSEGTEPAARSGPSCSGQSCSGRGGPRTRMQSVPAQARPHNPAVAEGGSMAGIATANMSEKNSFTAALSGTSAPAGGTDGEAKRKPGAGRCWRITKLQRSVESFVTVTRALWRSGQCR